ncbi:MAG: hypothetical protein KBF93_10335 [Leptospiraceae bacterium]|nr:hypothetical protein [Leptospiraceae bacterium]
MKLKSSNLSVFDSKMRELFLFLISDTLKKGKSISSCPYLFFALISEYTCAGIWISENSFSSKSIRPTDDKDIIGEEFETTIIV